MTDRNGLRSASLPSAGAMAIGRRIAAVPRLGAYANVMVLSVLKSQRGLARTGRQDAAACRSGICGLSTPRDCSYPLPERCRAKGGTRFEAARVAKAGMAAAAPGACFSWGDSAGGRGSRRRMASFDCGRCRDQGGQVTCSRCAISLSGAPGLSKPACPARWLPVAHPGRSHGTGKAPGRPQVCGERQARFCQRHDGGQPDMRRDRRQPAIGDLRSREISRRDPHAFAASDSRPPEHHAEAVVRWHDQDPRPPSRDRRTAAWQARRTGVHGGIHRSRDDPAQDVGNVNARIRDYLLSLTFKAKRAGTQRSC